MTPTEELVEHVESCVVRANAGESRLPAGVLAIEGFSDKSIRHFLNNLLRRPGTRYLDIGVWKGSTCCSALCGNRDSVESATLLDNWSQTFYEKSMDPVRDTFFANTKAFLSDYELVVQASDFVTVPRYGFFDLDCFSAAAMRLQGLMPRITTYAYDGLRELEDQRRALTFWNPVLADTFIYTVDDWKWDRVRDGTHKAFTDLKYNVVRAWERYDWWNGYAAFVVEKPKP